MEAGFSSAVVGWRGQVAHAAHTSRQTSLKSEIVKGIARAEFGATEMVRLTPPEGFGLSLALLGLTPILAQGS